MTAASLPFVDVVLPREGEPVSVRLRPLPLGFHRLLLSRGIVPPEPPTRVTRDSRGSIIRDQRGLAVMQSASHDGRYLAAKASYDERVAVLMLAAADTDRTLLSRSSPADEAGADAWTAHADRLLADLSEAGITAGDFLRLCRGVGQASGLIDDAYDQAAATLFPTAAAAGSPTRPADPAASTTSGSALPNASA